jgi:DNA repair exonuclease SbcCD ATPase subunit
MLIFHSVSFKNFLSTGDTPIRVQLDKYPTALVVGPNGAGKSTMLDAISFGLFGKPHRDIKNPQLINSINGKSCEVQIEFSIGLDKYRIVRGYKPSIFEIWKNGTLLNQESHSRDYQSILENTILKMNKKSFNQIVVLGAGNFVPFMQMPIWDRRGVIEDLLDISVFSDMNTLIKEKLAKSRDSVKDTENLLTIVREKVNLQTKHVNDLNQIGAENQRSIQNEILDLELQISQKQTEVAELEKQYDDNFKTVEASLNAANAKQQKLEGFDLQIRQNQRRIQKEHEFYSNNNSCPTCEQVIMHDVKVSRLNSTRKQLEEYENGLKQLSQAMIEHEPVLKKFQKNLIDLKKVHIQSMTTQATINDLRRQIDGLNKKIQESESTIDTQQAQEELKASQIELNRLIELRGNQIDERAYLDAMQEMLRDTGIKAKVIKQYVPLMNKFINQYLSVLDFFVSFTLDDSFNETIRSRHRDDFSYASFSEGEKMRINLAILFTWRQIAKLKNHNSTNLLILDETFDSSLDGDGVENLLKILNTLTATNVFVITHKPDAMADKMSAKLEFVRNGNFSMLKE